MPIIDATSWNEFIDSKDTVHILQTSPWGLLKSEFGWEAGYFIEGPVGAQVLFRKLPLGLRIAYIPKGPVGPNDRMEPFIDSVSAYCQQKNAVFLKIEPDSWDGDRSLMDFLDGYDLRESKPVQPRRTIVIDLTGTEEDILANMKQKTRYNIRLAGRKGVEVRSSTDVDEFYALMDVTGERDEFGVHKKEYYQRVMDLFGPGHQVQMLTAYFEGQALASIIVMLHGGRAWYFYGASSNQHRNLMPTYLLQWEGIRWAKSQDASLYDLWGIPDHPREVLEENFTERSDGLWGVYRFKRGFGGDVRRSAAAIDLVFRPLVYQTYKQVDRMFLS